MKRSSDVLLRRKRRNAPSMTSQMDLSSSSLTPLQGCSQFVTSHVSLSDVFLAWLRFQTGVKAKAETDCFKRTLCEMNSIVATRDSRLFFIAIMITITVTLNFWNQNKQTSLEFRSRNKFAW